MYIFSESQCCVFLTLDFPQGLKATLFQRDQYTPRYKAPFRGGAQPSHQVGSVMSGSLRPHGL